MTNRLFSAQRRNELLHNMAKQPLDVLVIGGGITGAGIVWDATLRGFHSGLIEMNDFAFGTSSRSTKLIHGGLRYLKQGEVKLVMEVGRERALLHRKVPHLAVPIPMMLPLYKGGSLGYYSSSLGLLVYDYLAGVKKIERRRMVGKDEALRLEPLLLEEGLKGAGLYYEYRTDDARLTIEILKSAHAEGAQIANYAEVTEFIYRDGKVAGVKVVDRIHGEEFELYAQYIVNACGPWVDRLRELDGSLSGKHLLLTKGVHLVVDSTRLPIRHALYFDVPDGRMIFVIPREGKTYIGTTDTVYEGDIAQPRTTKEDLDYLLAAVNRIFPTVKIGSEDVEATWAGLRPLIHEEGKKPSEISRKDEIFESETGLISIAGGKLTGFRKMAEKVIDLIVSRQTGKMERQVRPCQTEHAAICSGYEEGSSARDQDTYKQKLIDEATSLGISAHWIEEWVARYGSNAGYILEQWRKWNDDEHLQQEKEEIGQRLTETGQLEDSFPVLAELDYCVMHEMATSLEDFLLRRTSRMLFQRAQVERWIEPLSVRIGQLLGCDEKEIEKQKHGVKNALEDMVTFPNDDHAS